METAKHPGWTPNIADLFGGNEQPKKLKQGGGALLEIGFFLQARWVLKMIKENENTVERKKFYGWVY